MRMEYIYFYGGSKFNQAGSADWQGNVVLLLIADWLVPFFCKWQLTHIYDHLWQLILLSFAGSGLKD